MAEKLQRKKCAACTKQFYLARFGKDVSELDGMKPICLSCEQEIEDLAHIDKVHKMISALDATALKSLEESVTVRGGKHMSLPHAATLLEEIMSVWGGPEGYAQHLMAEYVAAKPGSQIRHASNMAIMNLIKFVSEQKYITQPLETMSDEKLLEHRERQRIELQNKLGIFDGESVPTDRQADAV